MFRFLIAVLLCTLTASEAFAADGDVQIREDVLFNFDWKFSPGDDASASCPDFDDDAWRSLDLPHDFQIEQPWDSTASRGRGFKNMGVGWYRKTFNADPSWKCKRVFIDFEGIMLTGDVWVNGIHAGGTDYGYLGFETDITDLLNYDGPNVVAVRADTGDSGDSRWYTGGGLFRDVHLVIKNSTLAIARHGVFVTTPEVSEHSARVNISVEVDGVFDKEHGLSLLAEIYAPDGRLVGVTSCDVPEKWRQPSVEVTMPAVDIREPLLWSCETPSLYSANVILMQEGKPLDAARERFGIRTVEFSKEYGLKLNGQKVFLKGIAVHHDLGAIGAAAFETSISRMMDRIKEFGFNHIRTSHNPYSEAFLDIADEKGILIVDELYDKWGTKTAWAGRKPWTELWYQNIPEWIKRDRNHPSVIMWSLGNELQFEEWRCGFQTRDWGVTSYKIMDIMVKRYDPTRKTTVAMYPARAKGIVKHSPEFNVEDNIVPPELSCATEVASYNYCWEDYGKYLEHNPDLIIYQSEAVTNELAAPFFGMDRDRMVGLAYWGAIEYWGEADRWPKKGWNYSFFNHSLEPYPQAWLMKSIFDEDPVVHIGVVDSEGDAVLWNDIIVGQKKISDHWNRTSGEHYDIYTYTNAEEVELFLNGKSLGVRHNNMEDIRTRNVILWEDIPYRPGTLKAVARTAGRQVAEHEIRTAGKPVRLLAVAENPDWVSDGMDLQYIRVYAVDSRGVRSPLASGEITVDVEGEATVLAMDNGDHLSDDLFSGNTRSLYKGFAMTILRSTCHPGPVKVKISCPGLKPAILDFETTRHE